MHFLIQFPIDGAPCVYPSGWCCLTRVHTSCILHSNHPKFQATHILILKILLTSPEHLFRMTKQMIRFHIWCPTNTESSKTNKIRRCACAWVWSVDIHISLEAPKTRDKNGEIKKVSLFEIIFSLLPVALSLSNTLLKTTCLLWLFFSLAYTSAPSKKRRWNCGKFHSSYWWWRYDDTNNLNSVNNSLFFIFSPVWCIVTCRCRWYVMRSNLKAHASIQAKYVFVEMKQYVLVFTWQTILFDDSSRSNSRLSILSANCCQ